MASSSVPGPVSHAFSGKARFASKPPRRRVVKKQQHEWFPAFVRAIIPSPVCSQSLLTFELFSVMVHSGSAAGGHYYACIKSFSDGQWYSFNDQHVSKVSLEQRSCRMTHGAAWLHRHQLGPSAFFFLAAMLKIISNLPLCLFFSVVRSPRKISGRRMAGPQGAEAITPVPLQGRSHLQDAPAVLWIVHFIFKLPCFRMSELLWSSSRHLKCCCWRNHLGLLMLALTETFFAPYNKVMDPL